MAKKPPKKTAGHFRKLAEDPNTRAGVADKFLKPKDLATRNLNRRLDAPAVPGSTLTNRDVAHTRKAAVQTRYGDQEQALGTQITSQETQNRDMQSAYDSYVKELAGHQANVRANTEAANTAVQALMGQQQAQGPTAQAPGTSAQVAGDAQKDSAIRQALLGSFGALTANTGRSAADYADTLAHVVGPGQRLQAGAQGQRTLNATRGQLTALKGQEGAYGVQVEGQVKGDESRNVLAMKALGLKENTAQTSADIAKSRITETTRHNQASEKIQADNPSKQKTAQEVAFFKKHGYYPPTGPGTSKKPKVVAPKSGPGSLTPDKESSVVSNINQIVGIIKSSPAKDDNGQPLDDHALRTHLLNGTNPTKKAVDPRIVNIAFDLARNGYLSPANVQAAHDLGIHIGGHFKTKKPPVKTIPFPRL